MTHHVELPQAEWEATLAWSRVVAACVVRDADGKYLMVQESQPKAYGKWNVPAGHVDKGEVIEHAALREAKEETGYDVELLHKIAIYHDVVEEPVRHVFAAKIIGGELHAQEGEILDVKWLSFAEISELQAAGAIRAPWIWDVLNRVETSS